MVFARRSTSPAAAAVRRTGGEVTRTRNLLVESRVAGFLKLEWGLPACLNYMHSAAADSEAAGRRSLVR